MNSNSEPAPELRPVETLVDIQAVRRLVPLSDLGQGGVQLQLRVTSSLNGRWILFVDPADIMSPRTVLNACVSHTGLYPKDVELFQHRILQLRDQAFSEVFQTITAGWASKNGKRDATLDQFVLPGRTIGGGRRQVRFLSDGATSPAASANVGRTRGTLRQWRQTNARLLGRSSLGITTLGAFLAAPLLPFTELSESMVVLLAGESSTGKSTIQLGAMSFQGRATPDAIQSPQTSARAWEEIGANFNNLVLPIEDFARIDRKAQRELMLSLAYNMVAGGGRTVSQGMQRRAALPPLYFRTISLAVSERNSNEIAEAVGQRRLAGEFARVLDLYAGPTQEGGVFDRRRSTEKSADLANELRAAGAEYYGTPLRVWIRHLRRSTPARLKADIRRRIKTFMANEVVSAASSTAVFGRSASKFGLLYAALMIGRQAKIVPWSPRLIEEAVLATFSRSCHGLAGSSDTDLVDELVGRLNDPDRCPCVAELETGETSGLPARPEWIGIRDLVYAGEPVIGLLPKGLVREWGESSANRLVAELARRGLLVQQKPADLWQVRLPNGHRPRLYRLSPAVLDPARDLKDPPGPSQDDGGSEVARNQHGDRSTGSAVGKRPRFRKVKEGASKRGGPSD